MQQIGQYLVGRIIGEGGMGKVYEAEESLSRRRVALKVLRQDLAQSEDGRRLFLREMAILSHLDHPNVVRCLACMEADGQLVMVLEHLDGQTLRDVLRHEARLPWNRVVPMAVQIAAGLGAAHTQQNPIVHRDLKPENIMVLGGDQTKVMDFGIAKILDELPSKTVHTLGTLQYMSPEQIEGRTPDPRADLYCLGLVLYEMLSGQPPYASESPRQLLNLQCTEPPPRMPQQYPPVPPAFEQLIYELLEKDPDRRPPNADAVRQRLEQLIAAPAPSPTGPMPPGATAMPAVAPVDIPRSMGTIMLVEKAGQAQQRRDKLGLFLGLGLVVLLIAGAGGYFLFGRAVEPTPVEQVDATPAVSPTPKETPPEEEPVEVTDAEKEARAREIRAKAETERIAAERAAAKKAAEEKAAAEKAAAEKAAADGGAVKDPVVEPSGDGGGIGGLFGQLRGEEKAAAEKAAAEKAAAEKAAAEKKEKRGIFKVFGDE